MLRFPSKFPNTDNQLYPQKLELIAKSLVSMLIMEAHSFRHTTKSTHAGPADVHFWCHWLFSCNFNTSWLNINKTKDIDRTYLQFPLWFPVARVYTDNGAPYNNVKIWTHKRFWVPSVTSNLPPTHINLNWGKLDFVIRTGTVLMRHRQSLVCVWKNRVKVSKNKKVRYTCPTDFRLWRHHIFCAEYSGNLVVF